MSPRARIRLAVCVLALLPSLVVAQRGTAPPAPPQGPPSASEPLPLGSGAISGVVVDGTTGSPVAAAIVSIAVGGRASAIPQSRQITDAKGRFAFVNLPASPNFTIASSKFGYLDGGYGRDRSPADPLRSVPLIEGEWKSNLKVNLWRPGTISGVVRDERGEPLVGIYVRALMRFRIQGRDDFAAGPVTLTDDRGAYRFAGLSPARYVISVPSVQATAPAGEAFDGSARGGGREGAIEVDSAANRLFIGRFPLPPPPANGRTLVYPVMFHPATTAAAQATAVELKFGDERTSVDITLEPVPAVRISGTVQGPPEALVNLTLRLLPIGLENLGNGSEAATAHIDDTGRFTFVNVPVGSYVLDAPRTVGEFGMGGGGVSLPAPPSRSGGWSTSGYASEMLPGMRYSVSDFRGNTAANYSARMPIAIGSADITDLVVTLRPHVEMSGVVKMETDPSKPAPPTPPRFTVVAEPAAANASLGMARQAPGPTPASDEFLVSNLGPGESLLKVDLGSGWMTKSIQWKGREYLDAPFDAASSGNITGVTVTLTTAIPTLSGTVRQPDASVITSASLLIFPADHGLWLNTGITPVRLRSVPIGANGSFNITSLPAGSYQLAAISGAAPPEWRDPDYLARLERFATRVTLTWGGTTTQALTIGQVR